MASVQQVIDAFNQCFLASLNTHLIGGADEPLYVPAKEGEAATIYFRLDYPSSALHEVAHWCIAGYERRQLEDYGYWYESDTRDLLTQQKFEQVEVKPQAVECVLHWAADLPFRVSVDNLALPEYDATGFEKSVMFQVGEYLQSGLPERARIFSQYLLAQRCPTLDFDEFLKQKYENCCR